MQIKYQTNIRNINYFSYSYEIILILFIFNLNIYLALEYRHIKFL
jgi:hypothetical protein